MSEKTVGEIVGSLHSKPQKSIERLQKSPRLPFMQMGMWNMMCGSGIFCGEMNGSALFSRSISLALCVVSIAQRSFQPIACLSGATMGATSLAMFCIKQKNKLLTVIIQFPVALPIRIS